MQKINEIFRRNLEFKIIAIVLAIIFWLWINSQPDAALSSRNNMNVPLDIRNQPANLVIVSSISPITVRINNTQGVSVSDLYAYVDLTGAEPGQHSFEVKMNTPQGVTIENISPKTVILNLDLVKDKIVPVTVTVTGSPEKGFIAGQPQVIPSVVNVRGPTSILDKLESVSVDVNVTGAKETLRVARPVTFKDIKNEGIFAPDPNLESLNAFPDTVEIIVPIYPQELASKTVPLRVAASGQPAEGMMVRMITPVPSQVQLLGDAEALKDIQYITLSNVDVTGMSSTRTVDYPLSSINLPSGVSFIEGTKISVLVTIGSSPINKTIEGLNVQIRNIPENLTAEQIAVDITINGFPEVVNALKAEDISVWVDAAGLEEGPHPNTTVYWSVPAGVSVVGEPKVELVLIGTATEESQ